MDVVDRGSRDGKEHAVESDRGERQVLTMDGAQLRYERSAKHNSYQAG